MRVARTQLQNATDAAALAAANAIINGNDAALDAGNSFMNQNQIIGGVKEETLGQIASA